MIGPVARLVLIAATATSLSARCFAGPVDDFYRGKRLTIYVGSSSGGQMADFSKGD